MLEDTTGWLFVFIVSIILIFDILELNPILAILINLAVLIMISVKLVDVVKMFLQRIPKGVTRPLLRQKLLCIDGVERVNNFYVWELTQQKKVVTVHVKTQNLSIPEQHVFKISSLKFLKI